ncbi:unnamed protein product [Staurois parvus]|uniref:Uncharacterized protein n=1 Tax=Staurois parvus TaxID=386267 RepID=A0ABN9EZ83_9NEOB|nr:unnamed protein product [Staurois parvus]
MMTKKSLFLPFVTYYSAYFTVDISLVTMTAMSNVAHISPQFSVLDNYTVQTLNRLALFHVCPLLGPLGPDVKAKRHEIKSDPTPLGLEGWPRHLNSLETYEDFSAIPSSNDELSNSSDIEEETTNSKGSKLFSVGSSFETCSPSMFSLKEGDVVYFIQCGENGQWLVKDPISKRKAWVPCNILTPAASTNVCQKDNITAYSDTCQMSAASTTMKEKQNEHTRSLVTEQKAVS